MATVASFQAPHTARRHRPKLPLSAARGTIGAILFMLVAFFLLAAGAATGAPLGSGAPVETDPSSRA